MIIVITTIAKTILSGDYIAITAMVLAVVVAIVIVAMITVKLK